MYNFGKKWLLSQRKYRNLVVGTCLSVAGKSRLLYWARKSLGVAATTMNLCRWEKSIFYNGWSTASAYLLIIHSSNNKQIYNSYGVICTYRLAIRQSKLSWRGRFSQYQFAIVLMIIGICDAAYVCQQNSGQNAGASCKIILGFWRSDRMCGHHRKRE